MNARIRELAAQANTLVSEEHPELAKGATMGEMANAKYKIFFKTNIHSFSSKINSLITSFDSSLLMMEA